MIPLSLYIHLPWCVKKCPYCDFNAHPIEKAADFSSYIAHIIADLDTYKDSLTNRKLTSIFIGGGTPSLFPPETLAPLFDAIRQYQSIQDIEVTIEANPGSQDCGYYMGYHQLGINRISIGGQSFNQRLLSEIGRAHNAQMTHEAILQAKQAGFQRINLDIMYGLPSQNVQESLDDLQIFIDYQLEHLSWYQLNIEANTLFAVKQPTLPPQDDIDTMDEQGAILLNKHGYKQYEISAWSNNQPALHNINYWHFGDYIGIGAGAHSKLTQSNPYEIVREIKHKHPKAYLKKHLQHREVITGSDLILEYAINHFRTKHPAILSHFEYRTGLHRNELIEALTSAEDAGFVQIDNERIYLTNKGFQFHNALLLSIK